MAQPITTFLPTFDARGNFKEETGWNAIIKSIFMCLAVRRKTRQWQPEFGSRLHEFLFEHNANAGDIAREVEAACRWESRATVTGITVTIEDIKTRPGKVARISMTINYNETNKDVTFRIPSQIDLLNGKIYDICVDTDTTQTSTNEATVEQIHTALENVTLHDV